MRQPTVSALHGGDGFALQVRVCCRVRTHATRPICAHLHTSQARTTHHAPTPHPIHPTPSHSHASFPPLPSPPSSQVAAKTGDVPVIIPHIKEQGGCDIVITSINMLLA